MTSIRDQIQSTLDSDFIAHSYPVLLKQGVKDSDVFMHSLGCSIWNTLGHELGYMALVEGPAPVASGDNIRSDSVWFYKDTIAPRVLIEFERYDGSDRGKSKLVEKLTNLMEASLRWEHKPDLLILSAWSSGLVSAPDFSALEELYRQGVSNSKGFRIPTPPAGSLLLHRMVLQPGTDALLRLKHMNFRWS
ncbi:hypothetical protein [Parahaliea mediterranea]|uniref:hypothetical protein n=1 Tax=Parahaliea mediterranea TaxID=651086 RepID=UPI000E2EE878|nr:hypothetical protein [Parahaliea mediterranea]